MTTDFPRPLRAGHVVYVDRATKRQLDPSGVAMLWPERDWDAPGLLVIAEVCEDPDCPVRDVQLWAVAISRDVIAVELQPGRQVVVHEAPPLGGWRRRPPKSRELHAIVDLDRWSLMPHPLYRPSAGARRLLQKLRAEMDAELKGFLVERYERTRRRVSERHAARVPHERAPASIAVLPTRKAN